MGIPAPPTVVFDAMKSSLPKFEYIVSRYFGIGFSVVILHQNYMWSAIRQ